MPGAHIDASIAAEVRSRMAAIEEQVKAEGFESMMSNAPDRARRTRVLILAGPCASGKSTLARELQEYKLLENLLFTPAKYTTRAVRSLETDGYSFMTPGAFEGARAEGLFFDETEVDGFQYATGHPDAHRVNLMILTPEPARRVAGRPDIDARIAFIWPPSAAWARARATEQGREHTFRESDYAEGWSERGGPWDIRRVREIRLQNDDSGGFGFTLGVLAGMVVEWWQHPEYTRDEW